MKIITKQIRYKGIYNNFCASIDEKGPLWEAWMTVGDNLNNLSEKEVEYIIRLGPSDRYRHKHIKEKGRIIFFRIQYETKIDDRWYSVVRYDTAHRFAHRDLMDRKGTILKTPLFIQDYNDALTFAESDLKSN